jgi:hypothetical protein
MPGHLVLTHPVPMTASRARSTGIRIDTLGWTAISLVDEALAGYAEWRDGADAVVDAYEQWSTAPLAEAGLRFSAFTAALDQEQTAAGAYADAIRKLERSLPRRAL